MYIWKQRFIRRLCYRLPSEQPFQLFHVTHQTSDFVVVYLTG